MDSVWIPSILMYGPSNVWTLLQIADAPMYGYVYTLPFFHLGKTCFCKKKLSLDTVFERGVTYAKQVLKSQLLLSS